MSVLLLDTHAYLWAAVAPESLSAAARAAVVDRRNEVWLSAASVWEMAIKHRSGKWPVVEPLLRQHDEICARLGVRIRPIAAPEALLAGGLAWLHTDPFDRMLAAQAMLTPATLVTRDAAFGELPGLSILW